MNFSLLSWNIQGTSYFTWTKFSKISPFLESSHADIFCLQEAEKLRLALDTFPRLKNLHRVLPRDSHNRNLILSAFPIRESGEIVYVTHRDRLLENTLWATVEIDGSLVKIYNCHLGIVGFGPRERAEQLRLVTRDARQHRGPVIICGDMNTTIPEPGFRRKIIQTFHRQPSESLYVDGQLVESDERYTFLNIAREEQFEEAIDIERATWGVSSLNWDLFGLKLDWLLMRELQKPHITLGDYISDHRSVHARWTP